MRTVGIGGIRPWVRTVESSRSPRSLRHSNRDSQIGERRRVDAAARRRVGACGRDLVSRPAARGTTERSEGGGWGGVRSAVAVAVRSRYSVAQAVVAVAAVVRSRYSVAQAVVAVAVAVRSRYSVAQAVVAVAVAVRSRLRCCAVRFSYASAIVSFVTLSPFVREKGPTNACRSRATQRRNSPKTAKSSRKQPKAAENRHGRNRPLRIARRPAGSSPRCRPSCPR